jgi:hypothetical protein
MVITEKNNMLDKTMTIAAQTRTSISSVVSSVNTLWLLNPQTSSPTAYLFIHLGLPDLALTHRLERLDPYVSTQQED